jgi:hypothetical protein
MRKIVDSIRNGKNGTMKTGKVGVIIINVKLGARKSGKIGDIIKNVKNSDRKIGKIGDVKMSKMALGKPEE